MSTAESRPAPFTPCKTPRHHKLAIFSPQDTIRLHATEVIQHYSYWHRVIHKAEENVNMGSYALARVLMRELQQCADTHNARELGSTIDPQIIERDRRRTLGTLAVSAIFRRLFTPDDRIDDAIGAQRTTLALDMYADSNNMPLPARLHMLPEDVTELLGRSFREAGEWYRAGGLYVRKVIPAEPSAPLRFIHENEGNVDTTAMVTIYPYIAAKSTSF